MNRSLLMKIMLTCLLSFALIHSEGCKRKKAATITGGTATAAPTITAQPANQTSSVGLTATFSVTATGGGLSYQWRKGGTNIVGATSATYTTPVLVIGDNGSTYDVVVTNTLGTATSTPVATLTVNPAGFPTVTTQPANQSVVAPATATFTVVAGGTGPFTYQWYRGAGTTTPVGTNSASYTTAATSVAGDNGAQFHVTITNGAGSVDSNLVTLTVTNPGAPTVTTQPSNVTVTQPATATFTVVAGGTGPFTYQWYRGAGTTTPVGTNSATYTTAATVAATDNGAQFHVVITNLGGNIDSNLVTLTVIAPPTGNPITGVPATITLPGATGGTPVSATFTVTNTYGTPAVLTLTDAAAWLTYTPVTVTIPGGGTQVITVTGDPVSAGGTQTATLTLTTTPGGLTQTVSVTINVPGAASGTAVITAPMQDVVVSTGVTLDGSTSTGGTYLWTQIAGPAVTLSGANTNTATFTAPANIPAQSLKFQLAASTGAGTPAIAIATVTVYHAMVNKARLFVDPVGGNDANTATSNSNSKVAPMKTLAAAYVDANSTGTITFIYMAAGADTFAGQISLRHNISVYGGFEATNWTRDVRTNITTVTNTENIAGFSTAMDNSGQALDNTDHLDGFTLVGGTGTYSTCLSLGATANPVLENMTFVGGTATTNDAECLRISSTGNPTFKNCTFTLGTNSTPGTNVIGIWLRGSSQITLDTCTFGGGNSANEVQDIYISSNSATPTVITNCNFLGTGTCTTDYNAIYVSLAGLTLNKSTIRGGASPTTSRALYLDFRSGTVSTLTTTADRCEFYGGSGVGNACAIQCRYQSANANAQAGQALTVTNSFIFGGSSPGENTGVEGWDNGTTGFTSPIQITLSNNTIDAGNASNSCTGVFAHGTQNPGPGVKFTLRNNILFTSRAGGTATDYVKLIEESTVAGLNTPAVMQNNLFFISTAFTGQADYYYIQSTPSNLEIYPNTAPGGTLDLATATSINGLITATAAPTGNINLTTAQTVVNGTVFFSTAPFNFHLKAGCPAVDAGVNANTPTTDFDGQTRPGGSTKDIGADEN